MTTLSIMIITQDCADTMRACLESVQPIADEIVIVDSGSRDNTLAICQEYTDKIYTMDWPGYGMQKQRALDRTTSEWVLSLDSDEVLSLTLRQEIKQVLVSSQYDAYYLFRYLVFAGKIIRYCDKRSPYLRLFRRGMAHFSDDQVHEKVLFEGTAGCLKAPFYHYSWMGVAQWMDRINRYTSLSANAKRRAGKRSSVTKAVLSAWLTFMKFYFVKGGLLDGRIGFVMAVNWAVASYYKYLKLAIDDQFVLPQDAP